MDPAIVLQKEPDWIGSITEGNIIILRGDGGALEKVPSFLLAGTSQLVRNILSSGDHLPLAYFNPMTGAPVVSLDSVSGEVLGLLKDVLTIGEVKASEMLLGQLQDTLKMLMIECDCQLYSDPSASVLVGEFESIVEVDSENDDPIFKAKVDENVCPFCFRVFKTKYSRDRHVNSMHTEIAPFISKCNLKCPKCDKTFNQRPSLEKHMLHLHRDPAGDEENTSRYVEENTFKDDDETPITDVEKNTSTDFVEKTCRDVDKNKSIDKHICSVCQKSYKNKTHLMRHLKIHEQVLRKFPCKFCSATFARKDTLRKHATMLHFRSNIDMESVRERFAESSVCQICGKDFGTDTVKFQNHFFYKLCQQRNKKIVEPTDKDRYECDQCNKSYTDKTSLQRHVSRKH